MSFLRDPVKKSVTYNNILFDLPFGDGTDEISYFESLVDPQWYLNRYEDVALAGMDPVQHYINHGRGEGRIPYRLNSLLLDIPLWSEGGSYEILAALSNCLWDKDPLNASLGAWVLAKWYGHLEKWEKVISLMPLFFDFPPALKIINPQGPFLLTFTAGIEIGRKDISSSLLEHPGWPETSDKEFARSVLVDGSKKLPFLKNVWKAGNVSWDARTLNDLSPADIDNLEIRRENDSPGIPIEGSPLVSVIMPIYNASSTIDTAIRSLLFQSWKNIEILAVDDNSSDGSREKISEWQKRDGRVCLIARKKNSGTYVCRNVALSAAKGKFITTHDADDWSHPEKIESQVSCLLKNPGKKVCFSHWVRCTEDLEFGTGRWSPESSWIYRNISSLMFRKEIVDQIGFWDSVSVNADTEYHERILAVFGKTSVIDALPGVPLSFGRIRPGALSYSPDTHLRTLFSGIRKDYQDAAREWHQKTPVNLLYLPCSPKKRRFSVPQKMVRGGKCHIYHNRFLILKKHLKKKILS